MSHPYYNIDEAGVLAHVTYALRNAVVRPWPFPHIVVRDILPPRLYDDIVFHYPRLQMVPLRDIGRVSKSYSPARLVVPELGTQPDPWAFLLRALDTLALLKTFLGVFEGHLSRRDFSVGQEFLVLRDLPGYSLGPHTDSPRKLLSALIYCPDREDRPQLGTSLYVPEKAGKTCPGGFHHPFEGFIRVHTVPYLSNTLFAFPKSDVSFHGVEPTEHSRNVIVYDIREAKT